MRRPLLLSLLPLSLLAAAACEDSSNPGGGVIPGADASFDPPDGSVITPPDAQPDATPATGVTVNVRLRGVAAPNMPVIFHDASGAVTAELKTDASGQVKAAAAPSQVTVLIGSGGFAGITDEAFHLVTYTAVTEGDSFVLEDGREDSEPTIVGSFAVTLPGVFAGTSDYVVTASGDCGSSSDDPSLPLTLDLRPRCLATGGGTIAVLGEAGDVNGTPLAFAFKKGNANPPANGSAPVTLGAAWATPGSALITGTNLPVAELAADYAMIADGHAFVSGFGSQTGTLAAGGVTWPTATGFPDAVQATVRATFSSHMALVARRQAPAATIAFDLAQLLPQITASSPLDQTTARPGATWTSTAPLTATDGGLVTLRWSVQVDPDTRQTFAWTLVVPPSATTVRAPALPPSAMPVAPVGTVGLALVAFVESDLLPDYAAYKRQPLDVGNLSRLAGDGTLPANGTVRATWRGAPF